MSNSIKGAHIKSEFSLMINGATLSIIFSDPDLSFKINAIFSAASSIIVFRSSPSEKAQTVKFL